MYADAVVVYAKEAGVILANVPRKDSCIGPCRLHFTST